MRTVALLATGTLVWGLGAPSPVPAGQDAVPGHPVSQAQARHLGTTVVVHLRSDRGPASTNLLGANHHYRNNGYGLWDETADAPAPAVVRGATAAGLQSLRFPGGTVANLYDWKRAVGPDRGCQVVGPHGRGDPPEALTEKLAFGPDEYMTFLRRVGARPIIMMPFVTETPADAADWVEYMNSPSGTRANPHGGTDWADVRAANGHPAPYGVHRWELGTEQYHGNSRYWMSRDDSRALREYAYGGSEVIEREHLGKACTHPRSGVPSDGTASQTFRVLYPPVAPTSIGVTIARRTWTPVKHLAAAGPTDRVFTVGPRTGTLTFGDGTHGAVPPAGRVVTASYRSVHQGYFAFARSMHEVDPSIDVCSSWGTPSFNHLVGKRRYDCLTAHAISVFSEPGGGRPTWADPLEGHDQFMLAAQSVRGRVRGLLDGMPGSTPLLLTEFLALHGDAEAFPGWATSVSHAVYMSSLWATWLTMGIPWGDGDDFLWSSDRTVLGPKPHFTFTADAVTRRALSPMFSSGGRVLATSTAGNPSRHPAGTGHSYPALVVAATRSRDVLNVVVVNRLPRSAVRARIRLDGGAASGQATVRSVTGPSFRARNLPDEPPAVVMHVRSQQIRAHGFTHQFPEASTTVFRVPLGR
jgi:alpha-N-arabinofuranosidase